jgi:GPH family glycoside/pentoside/hexuronide:cation symporter
LANLGPQPPGSAVKAIVAEAIPPTLQTKLEKARMDSFELTSHLEAKAKEHQNSAAHYHEILEDIATVNNRIASLDLASSPPVLDETLTNIAKDTVPLTKQTPFTLLLMRIVEIGLPVLLSIFSSLFLLRYSLTEKRSHEIKDLLRQRNEARLTA